MTNDLVVRGGLVVDGSGAPGRIADVAVHDGRITEVGTGLAGHDVIDASGHIVAPGFIDIHTHYDAQVFWDPALTPSCHHGVTSVIAGNCGFSIAPTLPQHRDLIARTLENVEDMDVATLAAGIPWDFETFPQYLASVARRGTDLNFGAYIGHTALRLHAMGWAAYEREATDDEIDAMARTVGEAIDAGAMGFATSFGQTHRGVDGLPVPSRLATVAEFETICEELGRRRTGVVSVAPGEPIGTRALYEIQPRIGVPFTYGALLTAPSGSHFKALAINDEGWEAGAEVWPQVTPRPLTFSMLMADPFTLNPNPRFGELMGRSTEERLEAYGDPGWRRRAMEDFAELRGLVPVWETYEIAESPTRPDLVGENLAALAEAWGVSPLDVACEIAVADGLGTRVRCVLANGDPDGIAVLLAQDRCTLGLSDAGAHVGQLCDAPQATDLLANWVRERQVLSVESAVRKLSAVQAEVFNIVDRGRIAPGAFADIAVFDLETVAPGPVRRVRDFPADAERLTADQPTGMAHVLVNGVPIRRDGCPVEADPERRPGMALVPSPR